MEFCVLYVTVPTTAVGESIALKLVAERLAACVNRIPGVSSVYRWKEKIEKDSEELLIIKTRQARVEAIIERVKQMHPYETPEIIALPIVAGSKAYLDWVRDETREG